MKPVEPTETPPELRLLAQLVVKQGVSLGGLPAVQLAWALAFVWAGLPSGTHSEAGINRALQAQLAGPAAFMHTDHVELRRWLVDAGWLQRDGYGRAYQRVAPHELRADLQPLAHLLRGLETASWAQDRRAALAETRAARRAAWDQRAAGVGG